jgi:hypothetical protein
MSVFIIILVTTYDKKARKGGFFVSARLGIEYENVNNCYVTRV